LLKFPRARPDFFGERRFRFRRQPKCRAGVDDIMQGSRDRRKGVAMNQREEIIRAIEKLSAIDVCDPATRAAHRIRRMRDKIGRRAHAAPGRDRLRTLEFSLGAGPEDFALIVPKRLQRHGHRATFLPIDSGLDLPARRHDGHLDHMIHTWSIWII